MSCRSALDPARESIVLDNFWNLDSVINIIFGLQSPRHSIGPCCSVVINKVNQNKSNKQTNKHASEDMCLHVLYIGALCYVG